MAIDFSSSSVLGQALKELGIPFKFIDMKNKKIILRNKDTELDEDKINNKIKEIKSRYFLEIKVASKGGSAQTTLEARVEVNGQLVMNGSRSYNLVVGDLRTGKLHYSNSYDVYGDEANADKLADELANYKDPYYIVCVFTSDEPQKNRTSTKLADEMRRLGATDQIYFNENFKSRSAYMLVSIPTMTSFEDYYGTIDDDPRAYIENIFHIQNGTPVDFPRTDFNKIDMGGTVTLPKATNDLVLASDKNIVLQAGEIEFKGRMKSPDLDDFKKFADSVNSKLDMLMIGSTLNKDTLGLYKFPLPTDSVNANNGKFINSNKDEISPDFGNTSISGMPFLSPADDEFFTIEKEFNPSPITVQMSVVFKEINDDTMCFFNLGENTLEMAIYKKKLSIASGDDWNWIDVGFDIETDKEYLMIITSDSKGTGVVYIDGKKVFEKTDFKDITKKFNYLTFGARRDNNDKNIDELSKTWISNIALYKKFMDEKTASNLYENVKNGAGASVSLNDLKEQLLNMKVDGYAFTMQPANPGKSVGFKFISNVNSTSDFGSIKWYDDLDTYAKWGNSSENGAIVVEVGNDSRKGTADVIALKSPAGIFLNAPEVIIGDKNGKKVQTEKSPIKAMNGYERTLHFENSNELNLKNEHGKYDDLHLNCRGGKVYHCWYGGDTSYFGGDLYSKKGLTLRDGAINFGDDNLKMGLKYDNYVYIDNNKTFFNFGLVETKTNKFKSKMVFDTSKITIAQGVFKVNQAKPEMNFVTFEKTSKISPFFSNPTDKTRIEFKSSNSSDPAYILHEMGVGSENNKSVFHIIVSDDEGTDDYFTIHGLNKPEHFKVFANGMIQTDNKILFTKNTVANDGDGIYWNETADKQGNQAYIRRYATSELSIGSDNVISFRETDNDTEVARFTTNDRTFNFLGGTIKGGNLYLSDELHIDGHHRNFRIYTNSSDGVAGTFNKKTTDKIYLYFDDSTASNDPAYIMHENSGVNGYTNRGVIHICPTDDNANDTDYVTIHGTNDPETIRLYTGGKIDTTDTVRAKKGFYDNGQKVWSNNNTTFVKDKNGYSVLPNGMIMQWGFYEFGSTSNGANKGKVTFPIAFPTACLNVTSTLAEKDSIDNDGQEIWVTNGNVTKDSFYVRFLDNSSGSADVNLYWYAIGY